jgi:fermentation-respiration switch protein FrsA (DUF1100 family)
VIEGIRNSFPDGLHGIVARHFFFGYMKLMDTFVKCALLVLCGYTAITLAAWHFHDRLIFFPSAALESTPKALHLPYEDARITTADGTIIHGWHIPAGEGPLCDRNFTLLHFHGNAGNISHRLDYIKIFNALGLKSLLIDYHGYGRSGGKPSVKGTEADALAAWNWLITEKGAAAERIVLHGHSLGGGVAGWLAGQARPAGLILEGTFPSLADVGQAAYPFLPVKMLIKDMYNTKETLRGKDIPALFMHSPEDQVVPYSLGRELYESYAGPKTFLQLTGDHSGAFLFSGEKYIEGVKKFLLSLK